MRAPSCCAAAGEPRGATVRCRGAAPVRPPPPRPPGLVGQLVRLVAQSPTGPSWRHTTPPGGRRSALRGGGVIRLLEAEARVVVEVDRVEPRAVVEVHPL